MRCYLSDQGAPKLDFKKISSVSCLRQASGVVGRNVVKQRPENDRRD